ncbi:MAG: hypothetical protein AAF499_12355, partial [Pseudomonadota bacterium]
MKRLSILSGVGCIALWAAGVQNAAATEMPSHALHGEWHSLACELRPQAGPDGIQDWYLKREITFSGNRIDAHFTNYADRDCSTPILELRFGGDVSILGPSPV